MMLDILETRDDKIKKLERRLDSIESDFKKSFRQLDDSFKAMISVVNKMEVENSGLRKEKDLLIGNQKQLAKTSPKEKIMFGKGIEKNIIRPIKSEIKENAELVRLVVRDGLVKDETSDQLYELVLKSGKLGLDTAARKMNASPARLGKLAKALGERKLIDISYDENGIIVMRKRRS